MAIFRWITTSGRFDFGIDWSNTTLKINPAHNPPGIADTADFAAGGGTITGTGAVAALNVQGGNSTPWSIAGQLQSGASFVNGATDLVAGGTWGAGSLTIGVAGALTAGNDSLLRATDVTMQSGTLGVAATGIAVVGSGTGTSGMLTVDTSLSGAGSITAANGIAGNGVITASGGTLTLNATVSGGVTLQIGANATMSLTAVSTQTVTFTGAGATLQVSSVAPGTLSEQNVIIGFLPGEIIRYAGTETVTSAVATSSAAGLSTLALFSGTTALGSLSLAGDFSASTFNIGAPDAIGTAITVTACYAAGTLIRTERGDVPVEALRLGDRAVSVFGGNVPLVWIGHRRVACATHPRKQDVWPVRVRANAFAPGAPRRDLILSPDHAVYTCGVLIPIRYMLNGATIVQEPVGEITYYHVELPSHDVILAEALPCESYLDTGNRSAFANGGDSVMLNPDFARGVWHAQACAELVLDGPHLVVARQNLLDRAMQLGHIVVDAPELTLMADNRPLHPTIERDRWTVTLPPGTGEVWWHSGAGVPADTDPASRDMRRLGVAVRGLCLDGYAAAQDDPRFAAGWHPPETGWRWTDGKALLRGGGVRQLHFDLVMAGRRWQTRPAACTLEAFV